MSNPTNNYILQELTGSDYEVADGQAHIRGWKVKDQLGKVLGEVDELLFEEASRKVRYLILDTDDNEINIEDRKIAVPIGVAKLHEDDDEVILPNVIGSQLMALPPYDGPDLSLEVQYATRSVFDNTYKQPVHDTDTTTLVVFDPTFYDHHTFDEQWMYRK